MQTSKDTVQKILRDGLPSILLYLLPVVLMLLSFAINGKRPWEKNNSSSISQSK